MRRRRFLLLLGLLAMPNEWYALDQGPALNPVGQGNTGNLLKDIRVSGSLEADAGTLYSLLINGDLTIGPNGKIVDGDGSYWDNGGIVLKAPSAIGDTIIWNRDPVATHTARGLLQAMVNTTNSSMWMFTESSSGSSNDQAALRLYGGTQIAGASSAQLEAYSAAGVATYIKIQPTTMTFYMGASGATTLNTNGDLTVYRRIYPGNQPTRYFDDSGSVLRAVGPFQVTGDTILGDATTDKVGFFGSTGSAKITGYSVTNGTLSRSYDADIVTVAQLADVVYTLITDLQAYALIG